jgi:hypothetical protein
MSEPNQADAGQDVTRSVDPATAQAAIPPASQNLGDIEGLDVDQLLNETNELAGGAPTSGGRGARIMVNGKPRAEYIREEVGKGRSRGDVAKELGVPYQIVYAATKEMAQDPESRFRQKQQEVKDNNAKLQKSISELKKLAGEVKAARAAKAANPQTQQGQATTQQGQGGAVHTLPQGPVAGAPAATLSDDELDKMMADESTTSTAGSEGSGDTVQSAGADSGVSTVDEANEQQEQQG